VLQWITGGQVEESPERAIRNRGSGLCLLATRLAAVKTSF
jgi:hypothetical protein